MVLDFHIKKFTEIWLQLVRFVYYENGVFSIVLHFILTYLFTHTAISSTIRKSNSWSEAQYKKNLLVILTIKKHNHLQYISYGNIWQFYSYLVTCLDYSGFAARFLEPILSDSNKPTCNTNYCLSKWRQSRRLRMLKILDEIIAVFWHVLHLVRSK